MIELRQILCKLLDVLDQCTTVGHVHIVQSRAAKKDGVLDVRIVAVGRILLMYVVGS